MVFSGPALTKGVAPVLFWVPCPPERSSLLLAAIGDSRGRCPSGFGFRNVVLAAGSFQLFYLIAVTELIGCNPQGGAAPGRQQTAIEIIFFLKSLFILFRFEGEKCRHLPNLLQMLWV